MDGKYNALNAGEQPVSLASHQMRSDSLTALSTSARSHLREVSITLLNVGSFAATQVW